MDKITISRRNITPVTLGRVLDKVNLGLKLNPLIAEILNDLTDSNDTVLGDASALTINSYADDINGEII